MQVVKEVNGKYTMGEEVTNYMGLNKDGNYPYDFYVGGTDACNGDSGGGLYTWKSGAKGPTLIGNKPNETKQTESVLCHSV